jgi:hypothetical protein
MLTSMNRPARVHWSAAKRSCSIHKQRLQIPGAELNSFPSPTGQASAPRLFSLCTLCISSIQVQHFEEKSRGGNLALPSLEVLSFQLQRNQPLTRLRQMRTRGRCKFSCADQAVSVSVAQSRTPERESLMCKQNDGVFLNLLFKSTRTITVPESRKTYILTS